jgi:hypothetical protein
MNVELEWQKELRLKYHEKDDAYELELQSVSEKPGIYIFGRRHGKLFEALYVGKASSLRPRIKTQLNNHKLLTHVWNAKTGRRIVMLGEFKARRNQTPATCLPIAERALIRYFVSEGHDLVNLQGVNLRQNDVLSTGVHKVKDFPNLIQVEAS